LCGEGFVPLGFTILKSKKYFLTTDSGFNHPFINLKSSKISMLLNVEVSTLHPFHFLERILLLALTFGWLNYISLINRNLCSAMSLYDSYIFPKANLQGEESLNASNRCSSKDYPTTNLWIRIKTECLVWFHHLILESKWF